MSYDISIPMSRLYLVLTCGRRVLDRLKGRWDGFRNKDYFDGLSDHSITNYVDNLVEYAEKKV